MRVLAAQGPITRPKLGAILELSKPTMSAAVSELSKAGLVTSFGSYKGATGRTAKIYGLGPAAGYVIGIDVGEAQVRAVAHSLDDSPLAAIEERIPKRSKATVDEIGEAIDSVARATMLAVGDKYKVLRSVAVAVPRIVSTHRLGRSKRKGPEAVLSQLRRRLAGPIILENNVNCAALGEMHYGAAKHREAFSYLQVGVRIGLGIVVGGKLLRGSNGAAGEIGRLPFPWSPTETPSREGLEHYLGSAALIERCARDWPKAEGPAPTSAKELFARAEAGSIPALAWVNRHAQDIGRLVAACVGMLDPGLIVLGRRRRPESSRRAGSAAGDEGADLVDGDRRQLAGDERHRPGGHAAGRGLRPSSDPGRKRPSRRRPAAPRRIQPSWLDFGRRPGLQLRIRLAVAEGDVRKTCGILHLADDELRRDDLENRIGDRIAEGRHRDHRQLVAWRHVGAAGDEHRRTAESRDIPGDLHFPAGAEGDEACPGVLGFHRPVEIVEGIPTRLPAP